MVGRNIINVSITINFNGLLFLFESSRPHQVSSDNGHVSPCNCLGLLWKPVTTFTCFRVLLHNVLYKLVHHTPLCAWMARSAVCFDVISKISPMRILAEGDSDGLNARQQLTLLEELETHSVHDPFFLVGLSR